MPAFLAREYARAHPRSRGDHGFDGAAEAAGAGSSPLARGPLDCDAFHAAAVGLIPARAGTTEKDGLS